MGSQVDARRRRARGEAMAAMLSLEVIGYDSDAPGSQQYPPRLGLLSPSTGDSARTGLDLRNGLQGDPGSVPRAVCTHALP